jgi:hypothetical protein
MRVGIAHHLGWAVAVTASTDHEVVDRRRIELIEPGMPRAPIHHEGKPLDDAATAALVAKVRASAMRATSASLDELAAAVSEPVVSMSLRAWPLDFPDDIAVQRRAPYESRADSIMYRQVLAECARARGWDVQVYDAKDVESQAASILGAQAGRTRSKAFLISLSEARVAVPARTPKQRQVPAIWGGVRQRRESAFCKPDQRGAVRRPCRSGIIRWMSGGESSSSDRQVRGSVSVGCRRGGPCVRVGD